MDDEYKLQNATAAFIQHTTDCPAKRIRTSRRTNALHSSAPHALTRCSFVARRQCCALLNQPATGLRAQNSASNEIALLLGAVRSRLAHNSSLLLVRRTCLMPCQQPGVPTSTQETTHSG